MSTKLTIKIKFTGGSTFTWWYVMVRAFVYWLVYGQAMLCVLIDSVFINIVFYLKEKLEDTKWVI